MKTKSTEDSAGWPPMKWPESPQGIRRPSLGELGIIRILILVATILLGAFAYWLFRPDRWGDPWLVWPLNISFGLIFLSLLGEWWYYWRMDVPEIRSPSRDYTVDVLTTACPGEPVGMIVRTLEAMQRIRYPHTSYLCDEGDDPFLKARCEELGVVHVTRERKVNAKAGNINNALSRSSGEICIILDPDHEPAPFMIDRLLGYFDDASIGFVQSVQAYRNQGSTLVARGAAEMQYHFYGPIQMGMHSAGTPQAIGANCAFRRTALESVGGHAAGLAEDMHTTMRLYAEGWKGAYVPEILTRGLVPQTLGAFYKQQLKWSCGVFDLFFQVLPEVVRSLSWRQRLHFCLCPIFFLQGWITFFGALVPILCLLTGGIAWKVSGGPFFSMALPLLLLVLLIRMVSQRFLAEPSERGLHLTSGILCSGTWWVFITGNLCALMRRKVPYLPTPKYDWAEDAWKISIPNLTLGLASLAAIPIGLIRDFSPYSTLMAIFAGWNALSLMAVVAMSQQKTNERLRRWMSNGVNFLKAQWVGRSLQFVRSAFSRIHQGVLSLLRERPVAFSALVAAACAGFVFTRQKDDSDLSMAWSHLMTEAKDYGGFYSGFYEPAPFTALEQLGPKLDQAEKSTGQSFDIASMYAFWGPESIDDFPQEALEDLIARGKTPMITWEPWTSGFLWAHEQNLPLSRDEDIFRNIADGAFDYYINEFAGKLRDLDAPVFLRFGHEQDNPHYPWSEDGKLDPEDFIAAWQRVVLLFKQQGASNIAFVYNPWRAKAIDAYYPGDDYVDWIGLTLLNYGNAASDGSWHSFDSLYWEFHEEVKTYDKPVMLAEFGSTTYGGDPAPWLEDAFRSIKSSYPQIRAAVLFHSREDRNWATDWRPTPATEGIDWTVLDHDSGSRAVAEGFALLREDRAHVAPVPPAEPTPPPPGNGSPMVRGEAGSYTMMVDGNPFYIRGVAYNPGHDWRDGGKVLSRREIDKDFAAIKSMGANTIRRYSSGWADYNLFNAADKAGLKVMYGLWLRQDLDYTSSPEVLDEYEEEFVKVINKLKHEPSLLTWVIGNEVWGGLKHSFGQPYLSEVRLGYLQFVERLARRIREVDPNRPIMIVCEHSPDLAAALADYTKHVPSADILGINSYYPEDLKHLAGLVWQFGGRKPYVVTEFGPDGYWHSSFSPTTQDGFLLEPTAREKAAMLVDRWDSFILEKRGLNLGGVAYCWSERFEASSSWFGLVSRDGTPKPAYAALQHAWTGAGSEQLPGPEIESLAVSRHVVGIGEAINVDVSIGLDKAALPLEFEWKVIESNFEEADARFVSLTSESHSLKIVMPTDEGRYWIHLKVSDRDGNMDEVATEVWVTARPDQGPEIATQPAGTLSAGLGRRLQPASSR